MDNQHIAFNASISQIKTTLDGGWRVTIDVSQNDSDAILELSRNMNNLLTVAVIPTKMVKV